MDATITYDDVANLIGVNIPSQNPRLDFDSIWLLRRHFKHALQCLPCLQSTLHGWKVMVMNRALYALLTPTPFHTPSNPGPITVYKRALNPNNPAPLTRTEQATIDMTFNRCKHNFLSMRNIEQACFTALDSSINNAFKVSNDPTI
jgi:hypothetical protein